MKILSVKINTSRVWNNNKLSNHRQNLLSVGNFLKFWIRESQLLTKRNPVERNIFADQRQQFIYELTEHNSVSAMVIN